jgi:hypothetical protein
MSSNMDAISNVFLLFIPTEVILHFILLTREGHLVQQGVGDQEILG